MKEQFEIFIKMEQDQDMDDSEQFEKILKMEQDQEMGDLDQELLKVMLFEHLLIIVVLSRWVSVVEFHDWALGIGKVFGQESTVVKWNYQILGLHQVTDRQKLGVILVIKWF